MNTRRYSKILVGLSTSLILIVLVGKSALAAGGDTTRVSVASDGTQGNFDSLNPSISADGRYVVFESGASNLVDGDTNGSYDIFVHDRQSGQTERVSITSNGAQGNGNSGYQRGRPSISGDGRYVAFISEANNLVSNDSNGASDIFVHDRQTSQTTRVSIASDGTQANGWSEWSSISADGRYVVFMSYASNLVSGDTNGTRDIFVHDRQMGQTIRVSIASNGTQGNSSSGWASFISADGSYVAFYSDASNLVSDDTNGVEDVFVYNRQTGQTTRVSVSSSGTQGNGESWDPAVSADGRYIVFHSVANNLVSGDTNYTRDIFVYDQQTGQTTRVSVASNGAQGNGDCFWSSISADGNYIAFSSNASNLVSGDTNGTWDTFVHDRQTGQTTRVSVASDGTQGNGGSLYYHSISADGRYVAFASDASNLVSGDTNGVTDIFVHELDITNYTISGNAGMDGAILSYTDGSAKTATSAADGSYSISVSYNWSGTVTPSKTGYTFSPINRPYTNVLANQTGQNYTAAITYRIYLPLVIR